MKLDQFKKIIKCQNEVSLSSFKILNKIVGKKKLDKRVLAYLRTKTLITCNKFKCDITGELSDRVS